MRAVVARAFGPPETLALEPWTARPPGPGEVTVEPYWAGVSFVDVLVAAGRHQHRPVLPFVPGSEFAGRVVEAGAGVDAVAAGDLVCGGDMGGIFAQRITLPASRVQRLPPGIDPREAAVLRASFLTAWYALHERGGLRAGEVVVVLGAAGAVGIAACQLARLSGAVAIASASTEAKRRLALANGASHAIDHAAPDWRAQVRALTGGRGADIVLDPIGGEATERALRALGYGGRHLLVGFAAGTIPRIPANLPLLKGASLIGVLASHFTERRPAEAAAVRARLLELLAAGAIRPPIGRVFPLARHVEAMRAAADGSVPGRVLLDMREAGA